MSTFLHSGDLGDCVHSLPAVRALGGGKYYLCTRPYTKEMTPARFEALRALLLAQPYITEVEMHKGQKVKYDLTGFRKCYRRGPGQNLATMHARFINAQLTIDTKTPWISVPDYEKHGRPVIARSPRYHCLADEGDRTARWEKIWPEVLHEYSNALFIGLKDEHAAFEKAFGRVDFQPTQDLLQVAKLIKGSSIFIGNQSSPMCVAEGLKHPSIQETHFKVNDVVFERANGLYISSYKEWRDTRKKAKFAIMLQVHDGDIEQAAELCRLITWIEPQKRDDIEFVIAGRFDASMESLMVLQKILAPKFDATVIRSDRKGKGWPAGCNALWAGAMAQISQMKKAGIIQSTGIFTMEPDCLPMRRDWINQLKAAWGFAQSQGKAVTGHLCRKDGNPTHLNGNLIITTEVNRHLALATTVKGSSSLRPWDCEHGALLCREGLDTPAIFQDGRRTDLTPHEFAACEKHGGTPAIWHGIKGPQGIAIAWEILGQEVPAPYQHEPKEKDPQQVFAFM